MKRWGTARKLRVVGLVWVFFPPKLVKWGERGLWDVVSVFAGLFLWRKVCQEDTFVLRGDVSHSPLSAVPLQTPQPAHGGPWPRHCGAAASALAPLVLAEGFISSGMTREKLGT